MIENAEMRIFGQISDLHLARMVREEREGMDEAKQRDEGFIMHNLCFSRAFPAGARWVPAKFR